MPSYDPQRERPRPRPADDEPAAIDALLGATAPASEQGAGPQTGGGHAHANGHAHAHHGHEHHGHEHEAHGLTRPAQLVATLGALAGAVFALRWWRRRRRS